MIESAKGRLVYLPHDSSSLDPASSAVDDSTVAAQCSSASCTSSPTKRKRLPIMPKALPSLHVMLEGRWIVTGSSAATAAGDGPQLRDVGLGHILEGGATATSQAREMLCHLDVCAPQRMSS